MGLLGPPDTDPVIVMLARISDMLEKIEDTLLGTWTAIRRDNLTFLRAHSSTALRIVQEYLELGRPRNDLVWANKIAEADTMSLLAVQTFVSEGLDGGLWMRPFSLKALGINPHDISNSWLGYHPNRDQLIRKPGELVWDHRFTLPAAAYAIAVRMAVLKAVAPESLVHGRAGCREMKSYANFLRAVIKRMEEGIWTIKDLDLSGDKYFSFMWNGLHPLAGADIHSGFSFFKIMYAGDWHALKLEHPELWPPGLVNPDDYGGTAEQIIARGREAVRLVGQHWWSLIWRGIGMVELCTLISDTDGMCRNSVIVKQIAMAQKVLLTAKKSERKRTIASVASGLANLTSSGDSSADAIKTYQLYQSLSAAGDRLPDVIARATEELVRLASPELPNSVISWAGTAISNTNGGSQENVIGPPNGRSQVILPGGAVTVSSFSGGFLYSGLQQLLENVTHGDRPTFEDLQRTHVLAFERNGSSPAYGGGWESCDWTFSDGSSSYTCHWNGLADAPRDERVVANGSITGKAYKQFFKIPTEIPEHPLDDHEVISFLLFNLPELDITSPELTITISGRASEGKGDAVTPDVDAIGVMLPLS